MSETRDDDKFYKELDATRVHKSCCTCGTLFLFFAFLLIICAAGIFYLFWHFSHEQFFPIKMPASKMLSGLIDKTSLFKFGTQGEMTIPVTDEEMSALLNDGISFDNFVFKNIKAHTTPSEINISGTLKPFNIETQMKVATAVENSKIKFSVKEIQTKNIHLPDFLVQKFDQSLNDFLNAKLSIIYAKINVKELTLDNSVMYIKGEAK